MEHLHAYWRMEYIEAPNHTERGNPFVELPKQNDDRATHIVHRSDHAYLVLNRFPYNAGHLLAIPYREVADLADLEPEERLDLMNLLVVATDLLKKALKPDGFNVGLNLGSPAGAGIPSHLHFHIVPRWSGDTNFMPVIGNTRVLPQSLDLMWERIMNVHNDRPDTAEGQHG
ncbi:MAG: HIT domain-containing protein [Verrucomicrobia bacterium]|nr:MAG: HIT domain-containing protein [Verrucomicrobiota bacterium]